MNKSNYKVPKLKVNSSANLYSLTKYAFNSFEKKIRVKIVIQICLMAILAFTEALGAALIVPYVALLNNPEQITSNSYFLYFFGDGAKRHSDFIIGYASLILLIFFITKNLFSVWVFSRQFKLVYGEMSKKSAGMFRKYMTRSLVEHTESNSPDLIRNITNEVNLYFTNYLIPALTCLTEMMVLLAMVTVLLLIATMPTIAALMIIGGLTTIFYVIVKKQVSRYGKQAQNENSERIRWVNQAINTFKESKLSKLEDFFVEKFRGHEEKFAESSQYAMLLNQTPRLFIESLAYSSLFIGVIFAIIYGQDRGQIMPILALFAVAAVRLLPSINRIIQSLTRMSYHRHSAEIALIECELEFPRQQSNVYDKKNKNHFENWRTVNFQNVSFSYGNSKKSVLYSLNITLNRYQSVALIGPSGSGKTTFVDILLGLLTPTSGIVDVDGTDIAANLTEWQKRLAYIPQSIYLIDSDIRSNVAIGLSENDIDDALVWEALSGARLDVFVKAQPEGLNFKVGENGARMSGGQRQRLGIARALYRRPELLVMDESTSALDKETEREISETIRILSSECTFVIIAHRPETIRNCNKVYKIIEGQVRL